MKIAKVLPAVFYPNYNCSFKMSQLIECDVNFKTDEQVSSTDLFLKIF